MTSCYAIITFLLHLFWFPGPPYPGQPRNYSLSLGLLLCEDLKLLSCPSALVIKKIYPFPTTLLGRRSFTKVGSSLRVPASEVKFSSCHSEMACYPGQPALQQTVEDLAASDSNYDMPVVGTGKGGFDVDSAISLRSHSTQAIVRWLKSTYQYEDGICLPRSTIYEHYTDFCARSQLQPVNAASFGKIIRQQFPTLTTRRLGTRGQSKYHYYGLGIKPTSIYYTQDYLDKQQNQGVTKKEPEAKKPHAYYLSKEKPSAVLPKFPDVKNLNVSDIMPIDKLHTFMVMYRAHCQRILDSVVRANFDEVENFLLHFWQGMPPHLVPVLGSELVVDLVAVCDMTLYKAIINIYITTPLQNIPDNVAQEVRRFTNSLKFWLEPALRGLPECLITVKLKAAELLCKNFKRQRSLMHLADAARNAFKGEESLEQLESDWAGLNLQTVLAQTLYTIQPLNIPQRYLDMVPNFLAEFSCMFADEKCSLEDFALWIESVMDSCLKDLKKGSIKMAGKAFLLTWKFFTSKVVREFTLMSAPSFGTFHLLHMLVDDYIMHSLETMLEKEHEESHLKKINLLKQDDIVEDIQVEDQLLSSSSSNDITLRNVAPPPNDTLPLSTHEYPPFVAQSSADFNKHALSSQEHASPPDTAGTVMRAGGGVSGMDGNKSRKNDYSSEMLPRPQQYHNAQDSRNLMGGLPMQLEPSLQGLGHGAGMVSQQTSSSNTESFRNLLGSRDDSSLQPDQSLGAGLRYSATDDNSAGGGGMGVAARSLSHPNLSTIPTSSRTLPPQGAAQPSTTVPSHSQAPIPFPANLGGFTLSSMVGHFTSHPQLQAQSLSVNPAGGLMQGLGLSVGSNLNHPPPISNTLAQSLSLSNPQMPGVLGGAQNPSISIMNPQTSLAGSNRSQNMSQNSTSLPMPLTHPITSNLQNPAGLPLLPGMPNMYSYPYTAGTLPTQPVTTSIVHVNAPPGFPSQSLMQGYSQYLPPSLYGNAQQPPVSSGNFSR